MLLFSPKFNYREKGMGFKKIKKNSVLPTWHLKAQKRTIAAFKKYNISANQRIATV